MRRKIIRYESFSDKIRDYHIRKLRWIQENKKKKSPAKFKGKYNTLTKAKSDIKKKIETNLEGALFYSKVVQWACLPDIKEHNKLDQFKSLASDPKLHDYPTRLNKDTKIRAEVEDETKRFIEEVFSEERMSRIVDMIFYRNYSRANSSHEDQYRVRMAEMFMAKATTELIQHMEPQFAAVYENDLMKVAAIARNMVYQRMKNNTPSPLPIFLDTIYEQTVHNLDTN